MKIFYEEGNALKGDLLYAEARKVSKPKTVICSGRHKAQKIVLQENAFCVIRKKLRFLPK
jgi:hypothetical protein